MTGIYIVTGLEGSYIGQSRNVSKRWSVLKCRKRPNELLYQSIQKYGVVSHTFTILHELPADVSQNVLDAYEVLYISQFRECGVFLFNRQKGGRWGGGNQVSPETKAKISATMTGVKYSKERVEKTRAARKYSPEMRAKISESLKKYYANK